MPALSPKIEAWEAAVLRPALQEVLASEALKRDFYPMLLPEAYYDHENVDELIQTLVKTMRRTGGSTLVIAYNNLDGLPLSGGIYVNTVLYREEGARVYASPGVIFWMKFNNKLHAFDHRYDHAIANHAIEDITRKHILDHVLTSFDFFKLHALEDVPFPGYR